MGGASSTNTLKSLVTANITVVNNSTAQCTNVVDVQSGMVIEGNSFSWFGFLKQKVAVTIDSTCVANLTATTETQQKIQEEFKQLSDAMVKGLSFNTAQASNALDLCTDMATTVTNNFSAIAKNAVSLSQPLTIKDNKGTVITGTSQEALVQSTMKQLVSTLETTQAFQDLVLVADQTARATVIGLDPTVLAMIIGAVIIAGIFGGSYAAKTVVPVVTSIPFWFLISAVLTAGSLYFPVAGALKLKVWPYKTVLVADPKNPDPKKDKNADTPKEAADKTAFNKSIMLGTGILAGCLGGLTLALLIGTIITRKSSVAKA
jgi:hypothetical protein